MKKIRTFKCSSCHKTQEQFVDDGVRMVDCKCGKQATRMISAPRCFSNSATCKGRSPSC